MRPTEILSSEHRVIEIVLNCLDRMVERAEKDGCLDRSAAEKAIDVIRNFADRCHHGKEENHLFATLVEKGLPRDGGPVGQMLREHEMGRGFVAGMDENLAAASEGDKASLSRFSENARNYVGLLRNHIQKEDRVLFPVADRMLDEQDQDRILSEFGKVESEHMGEGTHDKYIKIVIELARDFGVEHDNLNHASCHCSH